MPHTHVLDKPLKILVVLPMSGGSLPIGRYCASALESMGHTVKLFEAPAFQPAFAALKGVGVTSDRLEQLENGFLQVISQAITAQAETFEPHMVLALAQAPMGRTLLRRLRKMGIATAMWFVEDYQIFTYWRAFAPLYDVFAVIQKEPFLTHLHEAGQKNALYLPLAALPEFHKPLDLGPAERALWGADIAFMGAGYPNRRVAFRPLARRGLKIWGTEWDGDCELAPCVQQGGRRISPEECVKIYNATRININLHSSVQCDDLVPPGDFVNPRTFELGAVGAFQLVDRRALMDELFGGDTLVTFSSHEEFLQQVDYYLAHPAECAELGQKARAVVLERHTYQHRMQALIDHVARCLPGWPRTQQGATLPEELPENLRAPLQALLTELQLPADTPFADVIGRLRAKSGQLSELETTLLFLDEWRKQYAR